jgi:membrane protease YdiL (CAAX protease family)
MATRWELFAGVTLIVLLVVLGLSRATARELTTGDRDLEPPAGGDVAPAPEGGEATPAEDPTPSGDPTLAHERTPTEEPIRRPEVTRPRRSARAPEENLLFSAALSQALVGALLVGLAWYAEVPPGALGIDDPSMAVLPGVALGVGLYAANEAGAWVAERAGIDADESLRELLAPETVGGWLLLLGVVLPLVALVEEFLFRAALVGALAAGFSVSPWLLAVLSSVAFGVGHGLQGPGGVVVTGALGFVLAAAFVLTGSLWVVVVAHYLVNALEFLVHEALDVGVDGS